MSDLYNYPEPVEYPNEITYKVFNKQQDKAIRQVLGYASGGGASSLAELSDVLIVSPQDTQALKYDSDTGLWYNDYETPDNYRLVQEQGKEQGSDTFGETATNTVALGPGATNEFEGGSPLVSLASIGNKVTGLLGVISGRDLKTPHLGGPNYGHLHSHANGIGSNAYTFTVGGNAQTTIPSQTVAAYMGGTTSIALTPSSSFAVEVAYTGRGFPSGITVAGKFYGTLKTDPFGVLTIVGSGDLDGARFEDVAASSWGVSFSNFSNALRINCTGSASEVVEWSLLANITVLGNL